MNILFPGIVTEKTNPAAADAYWKNGTLHIVLKTPDGDSLAEGETSWKLEPSSFRIPSENTIENLLQNVLFHFFPADKDNILFPYRLQCVTKIKKGYEKKDTIIPYDKYQKKGSRNNQKKLYYLENVLTDAEWRIFRDLIQVYPYITEDQTKKFLKVFSCFHPNPDPQKMGIFPARYAYKKGSSEQFNWIDILDQAIAEKKKVRLTYGEYQLERSAQKGLTPVLKPRRKNASREMEPYALMWSNGYYYLIAKHKGMMNLQVDRILEVEILEESFTPQNGFDPVDYRNRSPIMYPGEKTVVKLRCKDTMINVLQDFFGTLPRYSDHDKQTGMVTVMLPVAPDSVKLFALQYADSLEVLEPDSLRKQVVQSLESALEKYIP